MKTFENSPRVSHAFCAKRPLFWGLRHVIFGQSFLRINWLTPFARPAFTMSNAGGYPLSLCNCESAEIKQRTGFDSGSVNCLSFPEKISL